jgi:hypothetical protein
MEDKERRPSSSPVLMESEKRGDKEEASTWTSCAFTVPSKPNSRDAVDWFKGNWQDDLHVYIKVVIPDPDELQPHQEPSRWPGWDWASKAMTETRKQNVVLVIFYHRVHQTRCPPAEANEPSEWHRDPWATISSPPLCMHHTTGCREIYPGRGKKHKLDIYSK